MQFVFPFFLIALLVLAIPILIHLFYFRKYKKVLFSNIKFLKEIKEQKSTLENLKKRLILASRLLALFFLVLAFTQPYFGSKNQTQPKGNTAACIYIDNSYSTTLKYASSNVLDVQIQKAKEIANSFGIADKLYLLTNDANINQGWMAKQDFLNALDKIKTSVTRKSLDDILQKQNALLNNTSAEKKWRIVLSDFQKNIIPQNIDTSFETYILPIQTEQANNIYIDSCWLENPITLLGTNQKLKYKITNTSKNTAENINVSFKINKQNKSLHKLTISAQSSIIDSFAFALNDAGTHDFEIAIKDFPITYDDYIFATLQLKKNAYVLSINEQGAPSNVQSVFLNDAFFILENNSVAQINYSAIRKYQFIVLNHIHELSSGLITALKDYVNNGGSLYVIPSKNINISNYNSLLSNLSIGSIMPLKQQNLNVKQLNLKEQVFKGVFVDVPKNLDYPKILQYYPINISSNTRHYSIIPTNSSTSLIHKFMVGKGLVYLQSAPLDKTFTDLGSKAIYAPIVYNMAVFQKHNSNLYYTIGSQELIEIKQDKASTNNMITLKNNQNELVPESRIIGNTLYLNTQNILKNDGIYTIYNDGIATEQALAFNYDRKESDLEFLSKSELKEKFNINKFNILDIKQSNIGTQVNQIKDGMILWKICVILSLLFLLIEVLLIRFMK